MLLLVGSSMMGVQMVAGRTHGLPQPRSLADSVMERVIFFAPFYEKIIEEYRAELYIKGTVDIRKKNHLMRYIPTMFRLRKGVKRYMMETHNDLHFTAPDIYDQKVKAAIGTAAELWELDGRLPEYLHLNVYQPTLLYDKLVSPLSPQAPKYYRYRVDSVIGDLHNRAYRIRFMPRSSSYQLVGGYLVVTADVWSVREMRFAGRSEMMRINCLVRMGEVGEADEFLPVSYELDASFRFLGNRMDASYEASLSYNHIQQRNEAMPPRRQAKNRYDLTESYTLTTDTNAYQRDTTYFHTVRPYPLTVDEQQLYRDFYLYRDTVGRHRPKRKPLEFWGQVGDALISRYTVDMDKLGSLRCSPLINPFLLSYGGSGVSYRQDFKYNRFFSGDRLLRIVPRVGYNFTRREFYWRVRGNFLYCPKKRASIAVDVGNGNRVYSSAVLNELKQMPDSLFNFSRFQLDYYRDLYLKVNHSWEALNGLTIDLGFSGHRRTAVRGRSAESYPVIPPAGIGGTLPEDVAEVLSRLKRVYNTFAPHVRLTWTPGQYYYLNGDRKVNLYSHYPTISVDWERGVKGLFNSTGNYERWEVDVQHNVPLGPLRDLYLRMGWGSYTKQKSLFFVDFANFRRSNLPVGWNDEIGGVFQLLDGRWYNSSRRYLRTHVTYESPFLLIPYLGHLRQHVLNERIYLNLLAVPHLKPYVEVGYGIGTHIFDLGGFASFANGKFQEVGCKFTFELFNR